MTTEPLQTQLLATQANPAERGAGRAARPRAWVILIGVTLLLVAALISAQHLDANTGQDLARLLRTAWDGITSLRWQFVIIVVLLAGLHYLATAIATRASAGVPLPLGETVLVQLAAAAANRITPAGIGGSAVTCRYFCRRGLDLPAAVGAVLVLRVLAAIAEAFVVGTLVFAGRKLGLGSTPSESALLTANLHALVAVVHSPMLWGALAVASLVIGFMVRRQRSRRPIRLEHLWYQIRTLASQPRSVFTMVAASATTTLILGFAFIATTHMVKGASPTASVASLLIAFMVGSALGGAVPVPAGLGSTEAALVAVLLSSGLPASQSIEVVLVFRIITFWSPAVVGVLATRHLHRRMAL